MATKQNLNDEGIEAGKKSATVRKSAAKKTDGTKTAAAKAKKTDGASSSTVKKTSSAAKEKKSASEIALTAGGKDSAAPAQEKKTAAAKAKKTDGTKTAAARKTDGASSSTVKKTAATKRAAAKKEENAVLKPSKNIEGLEKKQAELSPVGVMLKMPVSSGAGKKEGFQPEKIGTELLGKELESKKTGTEKSNPEIKEKEFIEPEINEMAKIVTENPVSFGLEFDSATAEKKETFHQLDSYGAAGKTNFADHENKSFNDEKSEADYRALEKLMQNSGLRKNGENHDRTGKEKKSGKKLLFILLFFLALLGTGIGIGVKIFSGHGIQTVSTNPEDVIAYCEKLIEAGKIPEAMEILAGLEINGNDENSKKLRGKIASLIKHGYEKAIADGTVDDILKKIDEIHDKKKYAEALKLIAIGTDISSAGKDADSLKEKLFEMEKKIVESAVSDGKAQDVIDAAKQLIDLDEEIPAAELLSLLDIKGNGTESRMMRNQIYSLKKDAVKKAVENDRGKEILDVIQKINENGGSVEALELLSFMEINGEGEEADSLRKRLSELKKDAVKKAFADGRQEEIITRARQMISDGDYNSALEFLSSVKPGGDDPESRVLRNSLKSLKKDTVERALAEGRIDDVFNTVDSLNANGDNASALELLSMVNIAGNSDEAKALRNQVNEKKKETVSRALKNGTAGEVLNDARQMIEDGDFSGALDLLNSAEIDGNDSESKKLRNEINVLKKEAVSRAIKEGRGNEILDAVERLIKEGNYDAASSILSQIGDINENSDEAKAFKNRAERLKKQNEILSANENLSDADKAKLAERLIKEGRYDEALTLLNSINADGNDEESQKLRDKISNLKKDAVSKAKKNGVDLGVLGYDENGNPVLSKEEIARRQQQERIAKEAAEKKAEEELLAAKIRKEQEEKYRRQEEERKAAEAKKIKQEAEVKALAEKKAREEAEKKAAEENRLKEQAAKNADERMKKEIENSIMRGKKFLADGNVDAAAKEFSDAESKLPSGNREYSAAKLDEMAKALYEASEKASGPDKKKLESLSGQMARSALKFSSSDPDTLYIAGIDALNRRNFIEAEKMLNEAISKNPVNFMYYYQLGRILAMQKKYSPSLTAFQNCVNINDKFAPAYYNSGYVSEQLNKKNDALKFYRLATDSNPSYENAFLGQGHVLMDMKKYDDAMKALTGALAINPNRAQIYQELGSCCIERKDFKQAENYFKNALLCPDATKEKNALTYYNLSTVMHEQKKNPEALDYAAKAYEARERTEISTKANIVYNYALLKHENRNDEEALKLYREVLMLDPKHVKANTNIGTIFMEQDKATDAILSLTNAYNVDPENFEVNNNLGSAYRKISNYQKSAEHFKNALKINPDDLTVKQNLARSYAAGKNYPEAKSVYEELISKEPSNYDHVYELANAAYEQGDSETAAKCLAKLKLAAPDYKAEQVERMLKDLGY